MIGWRCDSPVGPLLLTAEEDKLTGLWFSGRGPAGLAQGSPEEAPVFRQARRWLEDYFSGQKPTIDFPLNPQGTPFQRTVWRLLADIPYGETRTYGELAAQAALALGRPTSPRAVGSAVGRNPISIILPCHRVMGGGGKLTGFGGGVETKAWLLRHEGVDTSGFRWPKN